LRFDQVQDPQDPEDPQDPGPGCEGRKPAGLTRQRGLSISHTVLGVFCPRCGSTTSESDGRLICDGSGMDFSLAVRDALTEVVVRPAEAGDASKVRWGGTWHCPADATRMIEADGRVTCPSCKRALPPRVIYQLIELHVHPPTS
jgi:uncharacterized Zn finger protein (UPF0148 family)